MTWRTVTAAALMAGLMGLPALSVSAEAATPLCTGSYGGGLPVRGTANTTCDLRATATVQASTRNAVKALQRSLNGCYGQRLLVDGHFGAKTKASLKVAQKRMGATVTGVYDSRTRARMRFLVQFTDMPYPDCLKASEKWM